MTRLSILYMFPAGIYIDVVYPSLVPDRTKTVCLSYQDSDLSFEMNGFGCVCGCASVCVSQPNPELDNCIKIGS